MSALFSPLELGRLRLPNRIVIAPMCQYSAEAGCATDWHLIHLGQLALSGAGLLIIEATGVSPEGRISPSDLGLYSDENEAALGRVLSAVRHQSAMPIGIQLGHAGRKASSQVPWEGGALLAPEDGGWQTVAPSAIPHAPHERPPVALDDAGLARVREDFAAAARRAARLGLDLIELHCAHGYLLHQFLSPLSNQRDDDYGGSLENRMRLVLAVFDAVTADAKVFHAGTALDAHGQVIATGGRVLCACALGDSVADAQQRAYAGVAAIHWTHEFHRRDIGWRAIARERAAG